MIYYEKKSLFDAPKGSVIAHACNAQGVWGSGIAVEFKKRYPHAYENYHNLCQEYNMVGCTIMLKRTFEDHIVACLVTSKDFSSRRDSVGVILKNTEDALEDLVRPGMPAIFYSNKFNSGLFGVPWEATEEVLKRFTDKYNIDWVVCDPNLVDKK